MLKTLTIDKEYYCTIGAFTGKDRCSVGSCNYYGCGIPSQSTAKCTDNDCGFFHRKFPTPEQFKEEYGEEWTGAVYFMDGDDPNDIWQIDCIENAFEDERYYIICACTPFGKPPQDWRPS